MLAEGKVGQRLAADGAQLEHRLGRTGELVIADAHAKYYEPTMRGQVYSTGGTPVTLAATHQLATLGSTCTPIVGVYNPLGSNVVLSILKAKLSLSSIGLSAAPTGAFVWAMSLNNGAVSTGLNPLNRKTLVQAGSQAKGFAGGTALTGLTSSLVVQHAATFGGLLQASSAAAVGYIGSESTEEIDGSLLIPPGGVLALLSSLTPTGVLAASMLMWEEIPLSASL